MTGACGRLIVVLLAVLGLVQGGDAPGLRLSPGVLGEGELQRGLERLDPERRAAAWRVLATRPARDAAALRVDDAGEVFYACAGVPALPTALARVLAPAAPAPGGIALAPVPIAAPPALSSLPGAPRVIYLDFNGHTISTGAWLGSSTTPFVARAFSLDGDATTFSDAEQAFIQRVWERVAEDFAPFQVNVTTVEPASFGPQTARCLITFPTDANGRTMPSGGAGGVAYLNVFGNANFQFYQPALVYPPNLANHDNIVAQAVSHELGHNLGLSHDGTPSSGYYGGHGSGETSWVPIMGSGNRNVSQWSRGEYANANNSEDDLAIIANDLPYRADDHASSIAAATSVRTGSFAVQGIIERTDDIDVIAFDSPGGLVTAVARTWRSPTGAIGNNLDIALSIRTADGTVVGADNPATQGSATVAVSVAAGRYYLHVANSGALDPASTGYSAYASLGQWFATVTQAGAPPDATPPTVTAVAAPNVTAGGAGIYGFSVTYADNLAIQAASLDSLDVRVSGPGGYSAAATFTGIVPVGNGTPRTASYQIVPPGGTWDAADSGTYTIAVQAAQVADTAGNTVAAGAVGTFTVTIGADTAPPTVTACSAPAITAAGASSTTITVTYADNVAIAASTLDGSDLRVTGPGGFSALAAFASATPTGDGSPRTATYTLAAPGGSWDPGDNGTYTIALQTAQVADTAGNTAAAGVIGTFTCRATLTTVRRHRIGGPMPEGATAMRILVGSSVIPHVISGASASRAWSATPAATATSVTVEFIAPDASVRSRTFTLATWP